MQAHDVLPETQYLVVVNSDDIPSPLHGTIEYGVRRVIQPAVAVTLEWARLNRDPQTAAMLEFAVAASGFLAITIPEVTLWRFYATFSGGVDVIVRADRIDFSVLSHPTTHREGGPAIIHADGMREWRHYGSLHREDGPARILPDGTQEWFARGVRHREGGPAIIRPDGTEEWWRDGRRHREDGPAVVRPDGTREWWEYGKRQQVERGGWWTIATEYRNQEDQ